MAKSKQKLIYVFIWRDKFYAFRWSLITSREFANYTQNGYPMTQFRRENLYVFAAWGGYDFIEADIRKIIHDHILNPPTPPPDKASNIPF